MLSMPYHYRDARTDGGLERAFARVSTVEIFAETGLQFMTIHTLYQLPEDQAGRAPARLERMLSSDWRLL